MSTGGKPPRPMQQAKDSELNVVFISKGKKLPQLSKGSPKSAPPMPEAMHMYNTEVSYSPTNHEHALRYLQIGLEHIAKKGGHYGYVEIEDLGIIGTWRDKSDCGRSTNKGRRLGRDRLGIAVTALSHSTPRTMAKADRSKARRTQPSAHAASSSRVKITVVNIAGPMKVDAATGAFIVDDEDEDDDAAAAEQGTRADRQRSRGKIACTSARHANGSAAALAAGDGSEHSLGGQRTADGTIVIDDSDGEDGPGDNTRQAVSLKIVDGAIIIEDDDEDVEPLRLLDVTPEGFTVAQGENGARVYVMMGVDEVRAYIANLARHGPVHVFCINEMLKARSKANCPICRARIQLQPPAYELDDLAGLLAGEEEDVDARKDGDRTLADEIKHVNCSIRGEARVVRTVTYGRRNSE
ncbi:hypothetical protein AURDEDRAFT_131830 [Auricularia subglabra TFB-10046 SS5]|uniref:Uncharacterized protein n=1 Tax=Auricularia subglabra (strain TFB-10046 / SS5) TaxID=717982 RepID=J0L9U2_AURST|nr:hypothetical protein AURDEDRAFT_131830 [Auricularia subglabra TFB-10046 SS5]